ncbi:MAG: metalloregulator ArsR/SmtB family transcription factor [Bryobacterales bacterium]|nr:metalloregulator ArsR/SmtB family transcription factor [Bryobacterales bacterium]
MASILKSLRVLADPTRVRLVLLLEREELSVAELQEVLSLGQSTISTHLSQLKQAGLIEHRRSGKNILYRLKDHPAGHLMELLRAGAAEIPEADQDSAALALALGRRQDKVRAYFDELAGKFGRQYVPGRSWKGLAEMVLTLVPPLAIADLGAGEGTLSQLLARRAERVIAIDNSEKMVQYGSDLARQHGVANLEYRRGDLEALPIDGGSVDVALFSQSLHHAQHPDRAVAEAHRILKPGGRILVLDLVRHHFEEARELYADLWLGFTAVELQRFLRKAEFGEIETWVVHREPETPHFETILATAKKG